MLGQEWSEVFLVACGVDVPLHVSHAATNASETRDLENNYGITKFYSFFNFYIM